MRIFKVTEKVFNVLLYLAFELFSGCKAVDEKEFFTLWDYNKGEYNLLTGIRKPPFANHW